MENNIKVINSPYKKIIVDFLPDLSSILKSDKYLNGWEKFNRNCLYYKINSSFSSPTYPIGAFFLTLLYSKNFEGNNFFNKPDIKKHILDTIIFWCDLQQKNGLTGSWILKKYNYATTAIICADIADSYSFLKNEIDEKIKHKIINYLLQAGHALIKYNDDINQNHNAIAIYALYSIFLVCEEYYKSFIFKVQAEHKLERLLILQNKNEGWFKNYNGCDPGYLSFMVEYLAKSYNKVHESEIIDLIKKLLEFMSYFCHPDGSFGGEYGCLGSCFLSPVGFEISKKFSPYANFILKNFYKKINESDFSLNNYQDNLFLINKIIEAFSYAEQPLISSPQYDFTKYTKKYFPDARLGIRRNNNYYFVINMNKGGIFKLFYTKKILSENAKNKLNNHPSVDEEDTLRSLSQDSSLNDLGYYCVLENNTIGITQIFNTRQKQILEEDFLWGENKELFIKTNFFAQKKLNFLKFLCGNILEKIKFFSPFINYNCENFILNPFPEKLSIELERKITLHWYEIKITDKIIINNNLIIKKLGHIKNSSFPISSFFQFTKFEELEEKNPSFKEFVIEKLNKKKTLKITRIITFFKDNKEPAILMNLEET